jgi:predicted membrane channel-forming protein YqfA (hemolysin III family)
VLLLTSFLQSLNGTNGLPYFVLLLVEAILMTYWGTLQKRKIPFFAGIGFSVLNILAQLIVQVSIHDINRWFVAFGAGLLIMGIAIYIERSREQLRLRVRELSETLETWE